MELDFDKEIDALLRQTAKSEHFAMTNGSTLPAHIDADAISAFAENALPEKTRAIYMTHLADCDRCRKILSSLIMLGAESEVSASESIAEGIAAVPPPWYRRLFIFPNLAYTMGALVLVFSGLLGFLVLQNSKNTANMEVSQGNTAAPARPQSAAVPSGDMAANSMATSNSNAAMPTGAPNFQGTVNPETTPGSILPMDEAAKVGEDKLGYRAGQPATEPVTTDVLRERDDGEVVRKEELPDARAPGKPANEAKSTAMPAPPPPPPPGAAGAKPDEKFLGGTIRSKDGPDLAKKRAAESQPASGRRQLSGKTFSRTGGVWYDSAYQGQPTKDVRRGTSEYKKLDAGLRSIAESLGGTVVVVWRDGAYRIQ